VTRLTLDPSCAAELLADPQRWSDFHALCDCGGRLAGTASEARAMAYVRKALEPISAARVRSVPVPYAGWQARKASLQSGGRSFRVHPLVRTAATRASGMAAEVIDLGRGTPEEFEAHRSDIAGRIVLVRHELMFAAGTIHRRRKVEMAQAAGAVGFLIASSQPGLLVTGSSGRDGEAGLPSLAITAEAAAHLRRTAAGWPTATITIETHEQPAQTETLIAEIPGQSDEWIVLSAHVDGHDINESAIDNASGVAAALSALRVLAPHVHTWTRGVRAMFFSVEEWALTGSAQYVASLSEAETSKIALNVNLDSVAGSPNLTAMTSGFAELEPFLLSTAEANNQALRLVRPLMMNSDHGNFARAGIPAFRLVAGYDDPNAHLRFVLTEADTREKVARSELTSAALLAAAIVQASANASTGAAAKWRQR
jgi:aminopeptidase YwaD